MKIILSLFVVLSCAHASANETPLWCANLIAEFNSIEPTEKIPQELQATVDDLVERAKELTQQNGIDPQLLTIAISDPLDAQTGGTLTGVSIEYTDAYGWSQGNGMEFLFVVKNVNGKISTSMLFQADYWHIGKSNINEKACEAL